MLASQYSRKKNPEFDPLLLGTGWTVEDLKKPQVLLESTAGDSHPGSRHLKGLVDEAKGGLTILQGDLISIDIPAQTLDIEGFDNTCQDSAAVERMLEERRAA